jgi:hypothetical protein
MRLLEIAAVNEPQIVIHKGADGLTVDWGWTDWLGLVLVLIAICFVITVFVALARGGDPMVMLRYMKDILLGRFNKSES